MSRSILTSVLGVLFLFVASPRDAAANCQNGSMVQSISTGTSGSILANIMAVSTTPCTLNVAPGTYTAPAGTGYVIASGITIRGTGGAAATILQVTPPLFS